MALAVIPVIFVSVIFGVVFLFPEPAPATPTFSWSPSSVVQVISPGQSKTIPLSFTSSQNANNVAVRIVPALQPFVQANPSIFASISKGQTKTLTLTVSASATAALGTTQGSIQLRSGNTLAQPLPVTLNIWVKVSTDVVTFFVPQTVTANGGTIGTPHARPNPDGSIFVDVFVGAPGRDLIDSFGFLLQPNTSSTDLDQWFAANIDDPSGDLAASGTYRHQTLGNGEALVLANAVPLAYIDWSGGESLSDAYTMSPDKTEVVSIVGSQDKSNLYALGYISTEQKRALFLSILGTVQFSQ